VIPLSWFERRVLVPAFFAGVAARDAFAGAARRLRSFRW
jgi:hypothetical protein